MLAVAGAQQRMGVAAVALGGALVAGEAQWLGLLVAPLRDAPTRLRLQVSVGITKAY